MSSQKLTSFEQAVLSGLSETAALAALLLDAWANLLPDSRQTARSLVSAAQLGLTEETAAAVVLRRASTLGLLDEEADGFVPRAGAHAHFGRLAFALNAVEYYQRSVHRDATTVQVVLTKPPRPSVLEQKLSQLGWRTIDLEATEHAFHGLVRAAQRRVVVLTPFFDGKGAVWLQKLLSYVAPGVERILVLRSLEDVNRQDYPAGFDLLEPWLKQESIRVFNYSISRTSGGRETFHAKAVLCDRASAYLGSSNVNAASLEHSMEMGVVLHGRAAAAVADVVDAVLAAATELM